MPITTNTYNNIIWGSEYFPNNTYNVPDNLNTDRSFDTHNHDQSFIKSMVKFNDQSFILIGKFKYVYLTDNNIKYRLEVNGIVKFNSLGKIDEDFLKFTGNSLTANGNGFNSKSFQTVLTHNEVLFINTQLSPREILASVNDILLKNNNLYICGGFSTYRGVGISNNLTDDQAYNTSSLFKGRNSLVKISPINGDLDINTRFIFDSNDGLDDFVYNSNNYGYIDNRCSINTIVDYDADNILVGGSFTNIKLYKNSIEVDSKKSSIMKFNITTNNFSSLWDCLYYNFNPSNNGLINFIYINKGIHMDVVFNPVMNNNYVKQITTYESSSNFYNSLQESIVYDKKNKEVKKIIVLDDKSMFVVGKFNCFLDGSKKHWVNKILKLKSNGDIDPAFLPGHSATNYTYINGDQNYGSNYVINDRNTGYGFSMLDIAISMAGGSMNLYMSDIKIVDPNGDRIKVDDSGNIVTSGGRFIAYDDEIDIKPIDKSYVSDIIYFNNKILVCGRFNFFRNGDNDYYDVKNIIRLDLDGKVDASFNYSNNALDYFYSIDSIKLVNNGDNILIGGRPKFFNTSVLDSGETKNVFIKIKSDGSLVNGLDNNLKFRYYSVGDLQLDTFITKIPFINKIF